ncbi:nuclear transport factor 2 family protein [Arthrobacter sp. NPDC093128]|uniref:nuclear transport factor 2 family protein n=1 Tax=Arthrobacter sp. NPDC093128 TaxID=3154979 RepID=UPI003437CD14
MTDTNLVPETCPPAWAHSAGFLSLRHPRPVPTTLQELADRDLARESALRYSYAYDERRLDVLRSLLTDDAKFSISVSGAGVHTEAGRDTVVEWLSGIMDSQDDQRRHVVSNVIIEDLTVERAVVVTYLAVFSINESAQLATTGFYRFDLAKQDSVWRISHIFDGLDRPF